MGGKQLSELIRHLLIELFVRDRERPIRLSGGRIDEHQVDIGTVVEFAPAQLSQRDHGHPAARSSMTIHQLAADTLVAHLQDGVGQVGKLRRDFGNRAQVQYVAHQNPKNLAAAETGQRQRLLHAVWFGVEKFPQQDGIAFG